MCVEIKSAIRREIIARRDSLSLEQVRERGAEIQRRIMALPIYKEALTLALYANFNNEAPTSLLFDEALKNKKRVLFPRIIKEKKELVFLPVQNMAELEQGPYGILSPPCKPGERDWIDEAALLLIPGVAYDPKGGRVGYGGGFYDRTLHNLAKRPFIAALAYEFQVMAEVPMASHDVRVDAIITEKRVINCK